MGGVPVGREIQDLRPEIHEGSGGGGHSIVMVLATDAPLSSTQLERLARRATLGLAHTGATAHASSGDIAIAFSTAQKVPRNATGELTMTMREPRDMDPLFDAAAEATEEARAWRENGARPATARFSSFIDSGVAGVGDDERLAPVHEQRHQAGLR